MTIRSPSKLRLSVINIMTLRFRMSSERAFLLSGVNLPPWPPQVLRFLSQCFWTCSSPTYKLFFPPLRLYMPKPSPCSVIPYISNRKVYTITFWHPLSPLWAHRHGPSQCLHLFMYSCIHLLNTLTAHLGGKYAIIWPLPLVTLSYSYLCTCFTLPC